MVIALALGLFPAPGVLVAPAPPAAAPVPVGSVVRRASAVDGPAAGATTVRAETSVSSRCAVTRRSSVDDGDKEGLSHLPRHMRAYSRDDFVPSRASPPATPTTPTADDASLPVRQLLAICWLRMSHPMALKLSVGFVEFR